jgi:hypothetical protein
MRVVTWNVNGLAAVCQRRGLGAFLARVDAAVGAGGADIVCLQARRGARGAGPGRRSVARRGRSRPGRRALQGSAAAAVSARARAPRPTRTPRVRPAGDQAAAVRADAGAGRRPRLVSGGARSVRYHRRRGPAAAAAPAASRWLRAAPRRADARRADTRRPLSPRPRRASPQERLLLLQPRGPRLRGRRDHLPHGVHSAARRRGGLHRRAGL